jgi:hypothetical protein
MVGHNGSGPHFTCLGVLVVIRKLINKTFRLVESLCEVLDLLFGCLRKHPDNAESHTPVALLDALVLDDLWLPPNPST